MDRDKQDAVAFLSMGEKMMSQGTQLKVGIADLKVASNPNQIITLGLGSCVGLTIYDPINKLGGLVHVMLPDSSQFRNNTNPAKYADTGIPLLLEEVIKLGGKRSLLQAKLAGGAQMFSFGDSKVSTLKIGERNVEKAKEMLNKLGLKIVSEDTGGNYGRTIILDTENGGLLVRSIGKPIRTI